MFYRKRDQGRFREQVNVRRWIREWQTRFDSLGVQVIVADVAQSSVAVDVSEMTVVLAPSLRVSAAERTLRKVYIWWQQQSGERRADCAVL